VTFKYLHTVGESTFWLDHRLVPEVSAMLCAMASRAPVGGIKARYEQVVEAVAETLYAEWDALITSKSWADAKVDPLDPDGDGPLSFPKGTTVADYHRWLAEDRLCEYPLHPRVQKFFDDFVGKYGHSSIMELTGQPAVYSEGVSWFTAWQLFDSPLCAGQEFSTRAVQHADWPMARECRVPSDAARKAHWLHLRENAMTIQEAEDARVFEVLEDLCGGYPHPDLVDLHGRWFEVFEAEVAWWKEHLSDPANRLALGIGDKEPFRPALDRARWALPGTIATGCAHTTSLRERARVLRDGTQVAQMSGAPSAVAVWEEVTRAYREALPGLAGMGLREAVYVPEANSVPGHLRYAFTDASDGPDAEVDPVLTGGLLNVPPTRRKGEKSYLDVAANPAYRVNVTFRCSLAVARDWHRHRTLYPWHLQVVRRMDGTLQLDPHYAPKSDLALEKFQDLMRRSTEVFDAFLDQGNLAQAALALPLGTRVRMRGQGGLRDVVYMLELRKHAVGANFEYKEQATAALDDLRRQLGDAAELDGFGLCP
jgi:hypothetical protein